MPKKKKLLQLVLLRHGQSEWNTQHRLTGWADVDLTTRGERQAEAAGELLSAAGFRFDAAYTSELRRAKKSLDIVLNTMRFPNISTFCDWRLNERHYGALEGLGPIASVFKFGFRRVIRCQRRFDISPPELATTDPRYPGNQKQFEQIPTASLPRAESMSQTWQRVKPLWKESIAPAVRDGQMLLIVAHKNSLRVLIKEFTGLDGADVERLEIKTGRPLVYEFDQEMRPVRSYFLKASN